MSSPEPEPTKKQLDRALLRRVLSLFAPHRKAATVMLATVMVGVVVGLAPPFLLQVIIDQGLTKKDLEVTGWFSFYTILATLAGAGVTLLYGYQSVVIGQKIMCELRHRLFTHLQGMSLRFFTSTRTGEIQTRLISDVAGVQNVVSNTLVDALSNAAIVVSSLIAMFILDWRLTLLAIALIPFFGFFGKWVGEFARTVRKGTQEQTAELNSMMQEQLSVSGALLAKTIGRPDQLAAKFDVENEKLAGWQIKSSVLQYLFFGLIRMITQLTPALIYWLAGWLMSRGDTNITVGTLVAFTALQARMFFPLTGIMGLQVEIMSSLALFERIFQYIDMPHDIQDRPDAKALSKGEARGEVTFSGVGFKYEPESESWTLRDVDFAAQPGQLIALVGPSGAGKTTLTNLIARLYDVDAGQVKIDGTDVRDLQMRSVSEIVGAVTQETYLVHASVAENLRLAKPEATQAELEEACRAAAIHDHVAGLEQGYDTIVGERGYKLSGGEKQRIAIARAILKNPKVLILDEATSALDTHSERLIQDSLNQLMVGRTTFAIAHRLSTILRADQILVMEQGRIVERGRHEELLEQAGLYRSLYEQQFQSTAATAS